MMAGGAEIWMTPDDVRGHGTTITPRIMVRHTWRLRLGLWIIAFGCWLAGIEFEPGGDDD